MLSCKKWFIAWLQYHMNGNLRGQGLRCNRRTAVARQTDQPQPQVRLSDIHEGSGRDQIVQPVPNFVYW